MGKYKKAIEIVPDYTPAHVGQAAIYSLSGDIDKAYQILNEWAPVITRADTETMGLVEFNLKWLHEDKDFVNVRKDPRWPGLREKLTKKQISKK